MIKENKRLTYGRTSVYNMNYHLIWCTKYRHKVLKNNVEKALKQELIQISHQYGFKIQHLEIGQADHVHMLISAPPKLSVTTLVSYLKGISARHMFLRCPELKSRYWRKKGRQLWAPSYYVETIGSTNQRAVAKYIDDQKRKE